MTWQSGSGGIQYPIDVGSTNGGFQAVLGGGIVITKADDTYLGIRLQLAPGSSGAEMAMHNFDLSKDTWTVNADGSEELAGGLGRFGQAPPGAASNITGALSTVADAAAKAVLTSVIAALTADGGATNGTT